MRALDKIGSLQNRITVAWAVTQGDEAVQLCRLEAIVGAGAPKMALPEWVNMTGEGSSTRNLANGFDLGGRKSTNQR